MKSIPRKLLAVLIIIGILVIWIAAEYIIYSIFGEGTLATIIGIAIAFVIGAYFFFFLKKIWKKF